MIHLCLFFLGCPRSSLRCLLQHPSSKPRQRSSHPAPPKSTLWGIFFLNSGEREKVVSTSEVPGSPAGMEIFPVPGDLQAGSSWTSSAPQPRGCWSPFDACPWLPVIGPMSLVVTQELDLVFDLTDQDLGQQDANQLHRWVRERETHKRHKM